MLQKARYRGAIIFQSFLLFWLFSGWVLDIGSGFLSTRPPQLFTENDRGGQQRLHSHWPFLFYFLPPQGDLSLPKDGCLLRVAAPIRHRWPVMALATVTF